MVREKEWSEAERPMETRPPEPNPFGPAWFDSDMACDRCSYRNQDVDTFPCARCHTRVQ